MGLLEAFKQYWKDAAPGGVLNPEIPKDTPVLGLLADPMGSIRSTLNKANAQADAHLKLLEAASKESAKTGKFTGPAQQAYQGQLGNFVMNTFGPLQTVWHGSPYKFDKFDASKIGTGEGAQAYGHGIYFAESPDVAQAYANKLTKVDGQAISDQLDSRMRYLNMLKQQAAAGDSNAAKNIPVIEKSISDLKNNGALYKVDLPDDAIAKMLDWDKPLSHQHPDVQALAEKYGYPTDRTGGDFQRWISSPSGGLAVNIRGPKDQAGLEKQAAGLLSKSGIPGIRYLDGGSRGSGSGTSNFVVFPGNEGLLSILERNGQPIESLGYRAEETASRMNPNFVPSAVESYHLFERNGQPVKQPFIYPQEQALLTAQKNAALPVEQGGLGLRPDNTPMERAKALGFDMDGFHATGADIQQIDPSIVAKSDYGTIGQGFYVDPSPTAGYSNLVAKINSGKAPQNIMPVKVRSDNLYDMTGMIGPTSADGSKALTANMKDAGYSGTFSSLPDGKINEVAVFDPSIVRSRFAAFDPKRRHEADLLGRASPGLLGLLAGGTGAGVAGYNWLTDR